MSSNSESEPPSPSTLERMESERLGIQALVLDQVPKSLSQSDISESSHQSDDSDDDAQSDGNTTVAKKKPTKGKNTFAYSVLHFFHSKLLIHLQVPFQVIFYQKKSSHHLLLFLLK